MDEGRLFLNPIASHRIPSQKFRSPTSYPDISPSPHYNNQLPTHTRTTHALPFLGLDYLFSFFCSLGSNIVTIITL